MILAEGDNITLLFTIDANPYNIPTLTLNGGPVLGQVMLTLNNTAIEFTSIQEADEGVYTLSMTNIAGTAAVNITLVVEGESIAT